VAGKRLVDTSAVIDFLRGEPGLDERFLEFDVVLNVVILGELYYGAYGSQHEAFRKKNLEQIGVFLETSEVLLPTQKTGQIYAEMKAAQKRLGKKLPDNDLWIAASAREHDLVLAHRDKHFATVEGLEQERW